MGTDSPSVLVVGGGAIGALFGSALAKASARVSVVCRSDFDEVSQHGYKIQSALLGDHNFRPYEVMREVSQCTSPPDFLLLTTKVLPSLDRAALIGPAVGPSTVIVLIQNGIDIEDEIADAFPHNELLSSLAYIGVSRHGPGLIHHESLGMLMLGRYPSGITPAAEQLAQLFQASGVGCKLTEQVVAGRWQKAVWNAVFNPVSILGGALDTQTIMSTPQNQEFIRAAMREVCAVAQAEGHAIALEYVEKLIEATHTMKAYKTSMAQDYEARRPLEIEAILGNVVRIAQAHEVDSPILSTLYALTRMVAARI
ncbi:MAG: ketopantoate reductase family protein [Povalibacter sp.]